VAEVLSDAEFRELVQEVKDTLAKVRQVADTILHQGDWALQFLSRLGAIDQDDAKSIIKRLAQNIDAMWHACSKVMLVEPGVPWRLIDASIDWTKIGGRASLQAAEANASTLQGVVRWEGPAAYAYWLAVTPQNSALLAIKSISDEMSNSLRNVATGIFALWGALLTALVALLIELSAAATATATGVGAPVGVPAAGLSLAKMASTATLLSGLLGTYMYHMWSEYQDLLTQLNNNGSFPKRGHWPAPEGDMSDASVLDTDGSDWRIRL
jgi:hypothetical protein